MDVDGSDNGSEYHTGGAEVSYEPVDSVLAQLWGADDQQEEKDGYSHEDEDEYRDHSHGNEVFPPNGGYWSDFRHPGHEDKAKNKGMSNNTDNIN